MDVLSANTETTMKIKILWEQTTTDFEIACNAALAEGYLPIGQMVVTNYTVGNDRGVGIRQQWAKFDTQEEKETFKEMRLIAI